MKKKSDLIGSIYMYITIIFKDLGQLKSKFIHVGIIYRNVGGGGGGGGQCVYK